MKRGYIFGIIFLFSLIIISAYPSIDFESPTPADGSSTTDTNFIFNMSVANAKNLTDFVWNWHGTNYTFYNNSLVLFFNFNNETFLGENNTLVFDLSRHGNNATAYNDVSPTSSGKYGGAFKFSQDNHSTLVSDFAGFRSSSITVSLWVNLTKYNIKQVSAFGVSTCILLESGEVYCVGNNDDGQLGIGSSSDNDIPTKVLGDYNFSSIGGNSGYSENVHMCGNLSNGSILCWGQNDYGGLGDGSNTDREIPVVISSDYNFSQLALGRRSSCGLIANGSLLCWGSNRNGEVGGRSVSTVTIPTVFQFGDNSTYSEIIPGNAHTCGLLTNGTPLCWGNNDYGQLGINNTVSESIPNLVYGGYNFSNVYTGTGHSCGLIANGSLLCWGRNDYGTLGNGTLGGYGLVPQPILDGYNFSFVRAGGYSVCGVLTNSSTLCWGYNTYGNIGNGTAGVNYAYPVFVSESYNFSFLAVGTYHTCGLLENNSALCWGRNSFGHLGDGTNTQREVPTPVSGDYNFSSISVGSAHTCGVLTNGSALCWGRSNNGQIGNNSVVNGNVPTPVSYDYNFSNISCGNFHSCGVLTNGSTVCWGQNLYGQMGDGTTTSPRLAPVFVFSGNYNFTSVLSSMHNYAILTDGRYISWGGNTVGQQAVSSFNSKFPQKGFYKGDLVGKSLASFLISSSFGGDVKLIVTNSMINLDLDPGFNHLVLSFDGTTARVYRNGVLNDSFNSIALSYPIDTSSLVVGNNTNGTIDEVMIWNRTLSAEEIEVLYNSNLRRVDEDNWTFFHSKSGLGVGAYSYATWATNLLGVTGTGIRYFNVIVNSTTTTSSSGGGKSYSPSTSSLDEGYTTNFREGTELIVGDNILTVISLIEDLATFEIAGSSYEINEDETVKIDTDSDGYYDVQVSAGSVNEVYATLTVKTIYEEVPASEQEGTSSEVGNEIGSPEELIKNRKAFWILIGAFVILIVGFFAWKIFKKK